MVAFRELAFFIRLFGGLKYHYLKFQKIFHIKGNNKCANNDTNNKKRLNLLAFARDSA